MSGKDIWDDDDDDDGSALGTDVGKESLGIPPIVECSASTSGAWGPRWKSLYLLELLCACCACTPLLVPMSATAQLGPSCIPSTALAWLWGAPGSSSMCTACCCTGH
eukprot:313157-Pelagomonas_calceolata.AAC.4